tara:strand:+ start:85 stop:669 length:585 start_codon:yes stop_codon:yes gene_type:complete
MEYTKEETLFIQVKKPEFRVKPVPSLDAVIVEFLKKYEVFVQPISSGTRNVGESAVAGAITGMAGADVGGDAFMISGQNKQTKVQEWTQWKQWALDHKDFEAFKTEKIDKAKEHNAEVDQKLKDPAIQKQLEPVMEEFRKEKENERKFTLIGVSIFILIFVGAPLIINFLETRKENSSFNYSIIKSEKIREIIS